MSEPENSQQSVQTVNNTPAEHIEGACGGETGLRPSTPFSENDDNLSMEVRFSEGSSHHASDISSVSYQNLLDEDTTTADLSRRGSDDSVDSYLHEYSDDIPRTGDINLPSQDARSYSDKINERISIQLTEEDICLKKEDYEFMKSSQSVKSDPGPEMREKDYQLKYVKSSSMNPPMSVQDSFRKHELVVTMRDQGRSKSLPPSEDKQVEKKRNSLEIRNNIPVAGEVKNYEKDIHIDNVSFNSHGAMPKMRKQSPGLACRVEDKQTNSPKISNTESSSMKMDSNATQIINDLIQVSKANAAALNAASKKTNGTGETEESTTSAISHNGVAVTQPPADIINEYEYVKYSRIQEGNSYVGMRLAYSSSESDSQCQRSVEGEHELRESSRVELPDLEGYNRQHSPESNSLQNCINEDMLTEIPLNGPENIVIGEDGKLFTLSPENTECDSVEIESVVSDGDNEAVGMPNVEDGLSSSQTSDTEDVKSEHNTPKKMLQKKQQEELEKKLHSLECAAVKPKEMDAEAIMDDLKMKREALDHAISEIKSAIQKSKGVALETPVEETEDDPIWVKREETQVIPKGGSTYEVVNGRDDLETRKQPELSRKEDEQAYLMENEKERLLGTQYTRNDGKIYTTPKGYDSDDEYDDDDVRYTRRNRGKKYSQLAKDDSQDYTNRSHYLDNDTSQLRIDSVSMYGDTNSYTFTQDSHSDRRNSESLGSSEDFNSDSDITTKHAYVRSRKEGDFDTDEETDQLLGKQYVGNQYVDIPELSQPPVNRSAQAEKRKSRAKEVELNDPDNPSVLIEGVLFRARYLGSTQLISEGQPSKAMRMMQAQEAVGRIKAPEGENQPSTEVDLFVSTEKIMVLNTDLQEIMMDHSLRTISYIADIGEILVIMARRRLIGSPGDTDSMRRRKQAKIICHVFESEEAQLIAQSIGQAFQVAYMEFLKANGIEDPGLMKEIDYQEVLNQQAIYGEELTMFSNKENQKEVIVPKVKNEQLGVVIVESGWGSMVPTVVLANMNPTGPAARCGQLNIGDQIISVNGISLVGLPLSSCQTNIKGTRHQTVVKLTVVPCPPVVEVLIKRPDVKYQLGFSVQNGVICSLLRGGIAERGGVRVGHRIIEINNQSVVAVQHEKIVSLLANSVGEIHMKTMPTSIFRLLTGQETPHYL
ncbi:uncharacterized protein LOC132716731 isoform X3 [Ruditapes philippinarum]|uniref:uncharacterized protein LOC132716731 isoform X3 n=1 Tax=Ruditapes philippinarum TaxID=129788 RepID=UPI00295AECF7|nr:uncharacterized protein LOC132716731 isoform X3 [Ruditapes philippinarum]